MGRALVRTATALLFVCCLLVFPCRAQLACSEGVSVTIAILPCNDVVMTFRKFHPLVRYLEEETGLSIKTTVPKSFSELKMGLKNKNIDFVFQDPHTYILSEDMYDEESLIQSLTREGSTFQYGVIITRKESEIHDIGDLKGKSVIFGPELSATKWTAARSLLTQNGLNIDKDLQAYFTG